MTHQHYDVASLGNAIVDIIASVDDRFLLTHRIAKGTMTLIDEFRAKELLKALADNQQTMSSLHEVAGGSAANTMAGLASLGGKGLFLGKVSDDRLGRVFAQSMEETGVAFSNGGNSVSANSYGQRHNRSRRVRCYSFKCCASSKDHGNFTSSVGHSFSSCTDGH